MSHVPVSDVPVIAAEGATVVLDGTTPLADGAPADLLLLVTGSVVLVLGARFLREMKTNLPIELLLPIVTPLGDLSALRVFLWQFDGLVVVLAGALVMNGIPTAPGAALTALGITAYCLWAGLRRTGRPLGPLLTRLAHAQRHSSTGEGIPHEPGAAGQDGPHAEPTGP
ncbi:hypothetical protein [Streptomyces narbonensis]|uniref:hypothetical protein n=1 Tax=Streptomyces narbonensis TaxID=67333 RepID=UPI0016758FDD|nr:hypothetical protein [Streptomyces narbonensis]GGW06399.1 hypothetical protein GCM10010230_48280 [Streptomyces narbonensis]